jgi:hypothetical protein
MTIVQHYEVTSDRLNLDTIYIYVIYFFQKENIATILNTTITAGLVIIYIYVIYSSQKENTALLLNKTIIIEIIITVTTTASNEEIDSTRIRSYDHIRTSSDNPSPKLYVILGLQVFTTYMWN